MTKKRERQMIDLFDKYIVMTVKRIVSIFKVCTFSYHLSLLIPTPTSKLCQRRVTSRGTCNVAFQHEDESDIPIYKEYLNNKHALAQQLYLLYPNLLLRPHL